MPEKDANDKYRSAQGNTTFLQESLAYKAREQRGHVTYVATKKNHKTYKS